MGQTPADAFIVLTWSYSCSTYAREKTNKLSPINSSPGYNRYYAAGQETGNCARLAWLALIHIKCINYMGNNIPGVNTLGTSKDCFCRTHRSLQIPKVKMEKIHLHKSIRKAL